MPIYEYHCANCGRKVSIFWRSISVVDESKARCTFCGSSKLRRLVSRVRLVRGGSKSGSESEQPDSSDIDPALMNEMSGLDENDPRALGRFMRKMASTTGEELGPEFNEIVGRLEKGEDPEKIEQSMGDVLGESEPGGMEDDEMAPPSPAPSEDSADASAPAKEAAPMKKVPHKSVRTKSTQPNARQRAPKRKTAR